MKEEKDYIRDIAEIRSMMERSSRFLSLSGWAGIMAGIYALAGAYVAYSVFGFHPDAYAYQTGSLPEIIIVAMLVLGLALVTAVYFSWKKAQLKEESIWNATSRRLLTGMAVPLAAGGILMFILLGNGLLGLVAPLMLLFYGLALYNAGHFTISEVRVMGFVQMALGLLNAWFIGLGLFFWAIGFGVVHLVYGIYMHIRYER